MGQTEKTEKKTTFLSVIVWLDMNNIENKKTKAEKTNYN
jgi:hypothetical protein